MLALVVVLTLPTTVMAQSRDSGDIEDELDATRDREAATELSLEELKQRAGSARAALSLIEAELVAARSQLRVVEGQVALAEGVLVEAEAAVEAADKRVVEAERTLAATAAELAVARDIMSGQISNSYKFGSMAHGIMALRVMENAGSPEEVLLGMHALGSVIDFQGRIVDRVEQLEAQHAADLDETEQAKAAAEGERDVAATALAAVESRRAEAAAVASQIAQQQANQQSLLAELEQSAENTQVILAQLADERQELEAELAASRGAGANGLLCPVTPSWFINDWGYPRSGGRTHKGTDVFADIGTPIIAMRSGTIKQVDHVDSYTPGSNSGDLGGKWISYWTGPGEHWYWAHLDSIAAGMAPGVSVRAGDVIGYVGKTGNAYSTPPHVHVGHYISGAAVNPFPDLDAACR